MHDIVHHEGGVGMRGRMRRLEAAALIDGDVNQHRARLHAFHHVRGDQLWRGRTGYQHAADDQIGTQHVLLDGHPRGVHGVERSPENAPQLIQRPGGFVDHPGIGAHADRDMGRVGTDHAAAQNNDLGGRHARYPTEQHALAAVDLLQAVCARLHGEPARDLRHRREQRQSAGRGGHRLVGDAHRTACNEIPGLIRVRRQVQIGKQGLPRIEHLALARLWLLDLDDHLGTGEHVLRARRDAGAGRLVVGVSCPDAGAGIVLCQHRVAMVAELAHARRCQSYSILVVLDFLGYADQHHAPPSGVVEMGKTGSWGWESPRIMGSHSDPLSIRHQTAYVTRIRYGVLA